MLGAIAAFERYFGTVSTTEARLLVTAFVAILVAAVVGLGAPYLRRTLARLLRREVGARVEERDGVGALVLEELPVGTLAVGLLRALQLAVLVTGGLALLVVWGRGDLALALLVAAQTSVPTLSRVLLTVALLAGGYLGSTVLSDVIEELTETNDRVGEHEQQVVYRFAQVALLVGVGFGALVVWDINPAGLFVGAGFLGIVFGLAARQTLGSLVAGFVLMFSRPFEIGDWVQIGDAEGIVTEITIVNTRLRSFNGEYVSLPNDKVGDSVIYNRSEEGKLRLDLDVGIDYEADPEHAASVALAAVKEVDAVNDNPAPSVIPKAFGDSAVVLEVRFWIHNPSPPRKWLAVQGVITEVKAAFAEEGIGIPFPQRTLSNRPDGLDVQVGEAREVTD
ncbi:mechanosensitive ion channel family protein [Natronomonas sp. EA1]|uniref:mechanosensitive ion channel family protein n=1 Tax=Natronomonas sp. EA1 TaxID=3421655 RepID=UPI003EBF11D8